MKWGRRGPGTDRAQERPAAVERHVRGFFAGHTVTSLEWPVGPAEERVPGFRVLRVEPGPKSDNLWVYVSVGASTARSKGPLEFFLCAPADDPAHLETLTMTAHYHAGGGQDRLGPGHIVPIGRPWVGESACSALLVSLPYPFGEDLEWCRTPVGEVRLLWLLPITEAERQFAKANGRSALEDRFEAAKLEFWNPDRESVV